MIEITIKKLLSSNVEVQMSQFEREFRNLDFSSFLLDFKVHNIIEEMPKIYTLARVINIKPF